MASPALKVLYNASAVPQRRAGAGVYTLELGAALAARGTLDLDVLSSRDTGFGHWLRTPRSTPRRLAWEELSLARSAVLRDADVYHGPHFFVPRSGRPSVATVHDLTFFRIPRRYSASRRAYYRHLAHTARRANRIVVPSSAVATDAVRYLGYPPEQIRVIAEAPRSGLAPADASEVARFRQEHRLDGPYFACLGTAEAGKRAVDAIRALPLLRERCPEVTLVLAGNHGPLSAALEREAARMGVSDAVRFTGYLPETDLPALLTGAVALIFPSLYEGFGLPPLEALACGTPVIASDAPAMNEVLREGVLFVPLRDPGAIARAAVTLLEPSRRDELGARGREFVAKFSWARAAEETESVYRELVS